MIGLEKIREGSSYPQKQNLIGSWGKPEHSLKQRTSLVTITCSYMIRTAIATDVRSPGVIFGHVWKLFLPNIIKLTLKEKQAVRTPWCEPELGSHHDTPSTWKYSHTMPTSKTPYCNNTVRSLPLLLFFFKGEKNCKNEVISSKTADNRSPSLQGLLPTWNFLPNTEDSQLQLSLSQRIPHSKLLCDSGPRSLGTAAQENAYVSRTTQLSCCFPGFEATSYSSRNHT